MAENSITRAEFLSSLERFEQRITDLLTQRSDDADRRINRLDARFDALSNRVDARIDALSERMEVQFDDLRGLVRLSFEAIGTLRESTEHGFAEIRADYNEKFGVLHHAVAELGQKVAALERQNR